MQPLLRSLLAIALVNLFFASSIAQLKKPLNTRNVNGIIRSDASVRIQSFKNGRVKEIDTSRVDQAEVPIEGKYVVSYDKKVVALEPQFYQKFLSDSRTNISKEDVGVIPEIHNDNVSATSGDNTSFRIVFASLEPLRYNNALKKFSARIGFFLMPLPGSNNANISEPVNVEVVSNDVRTITPGHLQISHLNIPSTDVNLVTDEVSDSAGIKIITASNPDGYTAYLKIKPGLEIFTNRTKLQGYGIQSIPIDVRLMGSSSGDSMKVTFSASKGSVSPVSAFINYKDPTTIWLRSEGTGQVKLTATASNSQSNDLDLTFLFPWMFLIAAIAGGLIGSLCRYYLNDSGKKFAAKPIVGGIFIGLIGCVAYYALGVNLLKLSTSAGLNELAVFGFSALCAYFGIGLLPGKKSE